jgi:hypothetical protein
VALGPGTLATTADLTTSTLTGTLTLPAATGRFAHCGLATLLINLTLPGPGNTISLTLGAGTLGS